MSGGDGGADVTALPPEVFPLRATGEAVVHAAVLRAGWDGRSLCGRGPRGDQLWETAETVGCGACLEKLAARRRR